MTRAAGLLFLGRSIRYQGRVHVRDRRDFIAISTRAGCPRAWTGGMR